ncbi:MAG: hypothetical protein AAF958_08695 [Planctomycetota bacterium]
MSQPTSEMSSGGQADPRVHWAPAAILLFLLVTPILEMASENLNWFFPQAIVCLGVLVSMRHESLARRTWRDHLVWLALLGVGAANLMLRPETVATVPLPTSLEFVAIACFASMLGMMVRWVTKLRISFGNCDTQTLTGRRLSLGEMLRFTVLAAVAFSLPIWKDGSGAFRNPIPVVLLISVAAAFAVPFFALRTRRWRSTLWKLPLGIVALLVLYGGSDLITQGVRFLGSAGITRAQVSNYILGESEPETENASANPDGKTDATQRGTNRVQTSTRKAKRTLKFRWKFSYARAMVPLGFGSSFALLMIWGGWASPSSTRRIPTFHRFATPLILLWIACTVIAWAYANASWQGDFTSVRSRLQWRGWPVTHIFQRSDIEFSQGPKNRYAESGTAESVSAFYLNHSMLALYAVVCPIALVFWNRTRAAKNILGEPKRRRMSLPVATPCLGFLILSPLCVYAFDAYQAGTRYRPARDNRVAGVSVDDHSPVKGLVGTGALSNRWFDCGQKSFLLKIKDREPSSFSQREVSLLLPMLSDQRTRSVELTTGHREDFAQALAKNPGLVSLRATYQTALALGDSHVRRVKSLDLRLVKDERPDLPRLDLRAWSKLHAFSLRFQKDSPNATLQLPKFLIEFYLRQSDRGGSENDQQRPRIDLELRHSKFTVIDSGYQDCNLVIRGHCDDLTLRPLGAFTTETDWVRRLRSARIFSSRGRSLSSPPKTINTPSTVRGMGKTRLSVESLRPTVIHLPGRSIDKFQVKSAPEHQWYIGIGNALPMGRRTWKPPVPLDQIRRMRLWLPDGQPTPNNLDEVLSACTNLEYLTIHDQRSPTSRQSPDYSRWPTSLRRLFLADGFVTPAEVNQLTRRLSKLRDFGFNVQGPNNIDLESLGTIENVYIGRPRGLPSLRFDGVPQTAPEGDFIETEPNYFLNKKIKARGTNRRQQLFLENATILPKQGVALLKRQPVPFIFQSDGMTPELQRLVYPRVTVASNIPFTTTQDRIDSILKIHGEQNPEVPLHLRLSPYTGQYKGSLGYKLYRSGWTNHLSNLHLGSERVDALLTWKPGTKLKISNCGVSEADKKRLNDHLDLVVSP